MKIRQFDDEDFSEDCDNTHRKWSLGLLQCHQYLHKHTHLLSLVILILTHLCFCMKQSSESVLKNQLVSKICCFQLLELMYARLGKDELNSKSSAINQKFCYGKVETGKEMTQRITKSVFFVRSLFLIFCLFLFNSSIGIFYHARIINLLHMQVCNSSFHFCNVKVVRQLTFFSLEVPNYQERFHSFLQFLVSIHKAFVSDPDPVACIWLF